MSRRGYPTADVYEEREREFYDNGRRRYAEEYDELDVDISRGQQLPDYLREGNGRTNAGPLVMRDRQQKQQQQRQQRSPSPPSGEIARAPRRRQQQRSPSPQASEPPRGSRQSQPRRSVPRDYQGYQEDIEIEEELLVRRKSRNHRDRNDDGSDDGRSRKAEPIRRGGRNEEIDVDIQDRRSDGRRMRDDIEVDIREEQYNRARPRQRDVEEIDIDIRKDKNRGRRDYDEEIDVDIRRERPQGRYVDRDEVDVNIKRSARSQSRPRVIAREREEFIYKRREPSPVPQREIEEIIIRRPRTPSPTVSSISSRPPTPEPEPEPEPEPIRRPPIIQEIITHHRHIDHGVVRAPPTEASSSSSSSPSPSPPPVRRKRRDLEIDIVRKDAKGNVFEEDIRIIDDSRSERSARTKPRELEMRKPSKTEPPPPAPAPRRLREETNINIDLDLRGSTKSGSSKKDGSQGRWTEVAKDLVIRDAIEKMGYDYQENEKFFYVMEYLRFEDVAQLVDMTDDMRKRQDRIEDTHWEPEDPRLRPVRPPPNNWDERRYEREVIYEERPRRYR